MSIDTETRDLMRHMNWSRGGCDSCNRENCSVTPFGSDEDGQPVGYICFVCMKKEARWNVVHRFEQIEASRSGRTPVSRR